MTAAQELYDTIKAAWDDISPYDPETSHDFDSLLEHELSTADRTDPVMDGLCEILADGGEYLDQAAEFLNA